jgi:hypothetical protein
VLKTFKQYFEDRQMMMFSTKPVELYHASNTGKGNSVLNSFKTRGILSNLAQGYGQGEGFYVFSDKKSAIKHSNEIIKGDSITTKAEKDGYPMVVTVEAIPDPEKWDLDYELNYSILIDWLHDNFEKFQDLVSDNEVGLKAKMYRNVYNHKDEFVPSKGITFKSGRGISSRFSKSWSQNDIGLGQMLGSVINKIQEKDPETVRKFEELFFANMRPGVAIKYVGNEALQPKKIEVFKDENWVVV